MTANAEFESLYRAQTRTKDDAAIRAANEMAEHILGHEVADQNDILRQIYNRIAMARAGQIEALESRIDEMRKEIERIKSANGIFEQPKTISG